MKTTTNNVQKFTNQSAYCEGCNATFEVDVILDLETSIQYFTCPECGQPNKRGNING